VPKTSIAFTFRQDLVFAQSHSIDSKEISRVFPQKSKTKCAFLLVGGAMG
jgi:hypothetical protein